MTFRPSIDPKTRNDLKQIYDQMMWLAKCPNVSPSKARAWYTHIVAESMKRRLRHFTGKVSVAAAADPSGVLRLEHFMRIQTTLTKLVERHLKLKRPNPSEFIRVVCECELVHIVTFQENYDAMRAGGDYKKAGIKLRSWGSLPKATQQILWDKMLRGKVANAQEYS